MTTPLVARFHERETRSKRIVLIARVADAIQSGAYVALVDVRGELFLQVVESDDPVLLTAKQVIERMQP
jgi:hypothetical protein